jgi:hypothetical protein
MWMALPTLGLAQSPTGAETSDAPSEVHHVDAPTPPRRLAPEVSFEVGGSAVIPLFTEPLCPGNHLCVLNGGVGVRVGVERRWPDGWALISRYDVWIFDANALYEIGVLHAARIGARYVIDWRTIVHPYVEGMVGFLAMGDTAHVATAGGTVSVGGGTEIELTDSVAIDVDAELWALATGMFTTQDMVRRSDGFGANLVLEITLALNVLLGNF